MLCAIDNLIRRQHARDRSHTLHIRRLRVRRGDRLAVIGPSGCGKSTTLDILGLVLRPDSADRFRFTPEGGGESLSSGPESGDIMPLWHSGRPDQMAGLRLRHIGHVLQGGGLLPFITVGKNMTLTARMGGMNAAKALDAARALAEDLGIAHLMDAMPATLSVGERQRAAIVRALTPRPRLILADEPTAALDPCHAGQVMKLFLRAVEKQDGTLIMVTHDIAFARSGGLREVVFRIEEEGNGVRAVLNDESRILSDASEETCAE